MFSTCYHFHRIIPWCAKMRAIHTHVLLLLLLFLLPQSTFKVSANPCNYSQPLTHSGVDPDQSPAYNLSYQHTPTVFTMSLSVDITGRGQGKGIAGAFFLAKDRLNQEANTFGINATFAYSFHDTRNREVDAMKVMADLYCENDTSVFIGPMAHCKPAALMAAAFNIPYLSYDCQDNYEPTAPNMFINTAPSIVYVAGKIVSLMRGLKWTSFWLINGPTLACEYTGKRLRKTATQSDIKIRGEDVVRANKWHIPQDAKGNPYTKVIKLSMNRTRVYVYLGSSESMIIFLRELMKLTGKNRGLYGVIAVNIDQTEVMRGPDQFYLTVTEIHVEKNITKEEEQHKLNAFRNLLLIRSKKVSVKFLDTKIYERNLLPPINYTPFPFGNKEPKINSIAYNLYDATILYGRAAMCLMITPGMDPHNRTQIQDSIRNKKHDSVLGPPIIIHNNGQREDAYQVWMPEYQGNTIVPSMQVVGSFEIVNNQTRLIRNGQFIWINGPPESAPVCGWEAELCKKDVGGANSIIIIVVAILVVLVIIIVVVIDRYRRFRYEKKLEKLLWMINREDIQMKDKKEIKEVHSSSKPKRKDSNPQKCLLIPLDPKNDLDIDDDADADKSTPDVETRYGIYKGTKVFIRQLSEDCEVSRNLKKQFQLRKEMSNDNINRFLGACVEQSKIFIVTEFCRSKSLEDVLQVQDDESPLDDMFITSLVQDLIKGMTFIHDSGFGCHGNLKSSNCLVDARWTLKITDFGIAGFGPSSDYLLLGEEHFRKLLWTAPELLVRMNDFCSSHHPNQSQRSLSIPYQRNNSTSVKNNVGSQKGDVYSFAIILYEIYGREGPWGPLKKTNKEIIESLIKTSLPPPRPDTSHLTCSNDVIGLIKACWDQDPVLRPDFKEGIRNRFKSDQKKYIKTNNMLEMMEKHSSKLESSVEERTRQLKEEKKLTENLLHRMLPRSVAESLKRGRRVEPKQFEQVAIYFSDIVGFTELSARCMPIEVVNLLNKLYTLFDDIIGKFDVYKVETIGDAYMVVSGPPNCSNGCDSHSGEIASMALQLLEVIKGEKFAVQGSKNTLLKIRIGIHSGPCCAGVVGLKMPRYCLFGDTVNTANRMESTGEAGRIHCSSECKKILDRLGGYHLEERGYTEMKGKGSLLTYFLKDEEVIIRERRLSNPQSGRCVSTSNPDYYPSRPNSQQGLPPQGHGIGYKSPGVDRSSAFSSLNSSMDSAMFQANEDLHNSDSNSTLSQPVDNNMSSSMSKYTSAYSMTPIAEHPLRSTDQLDSIVLAFTNSSPHCGTESESDSLLVTEPAVELKKPPHRWSTGTTTKPRHPLARTSCDLPNGVTPETVL